jgi:hypothetical protein
VELLVAAVAVNHAGSQPTLLVVTTVAKAPTTVLLEVLFVPV